MNVDLTSPIFHDEDKAREWLEQARWPNVRPARIAVLSVHHGWAARLGVPACSIAPTVAASSPFGLAK